MKKARSFLILFMVLYSFSGSGVALAEDGDGAEVSLPVFAVNAVEGVPGLLSEMAGKKVVLLGDGSHGTEEFYAFRKWLTRILIRDYGYRVLILEAEWDSAEQFDLYIRNQLQNPIENRKFLAAAFDRWPQWVWANEEMAEFIDWLKLFNLEVSPGMPVYCYGMDMQLAVEGSLQFLLDKVPEDSVLRSRLIDLYNWWQPYIEDPILFNRAYVDGQETGSLLATEILESIDSPPFNLEWRLKMLASAEEYYRTMSYDGYKAWNIRSRYFADYVLNVLTHPQSRGGVIVWAHNSHVGDMAGSNVEGTGLINLGHLLRQALGRKKVFILGSTSYRGTVAAASDWGEPVQTIDVPPAASGSLEELLESGGWENPLLLFRTEEERKLWAQPLLHRGIGVDYDPENEVPTNYLVTRVSDRYDALVFWRKTRALAPLMEP